MAEALLVKSGGGTDSDDLTATLSQVLSGYTAMTSDSNDDPGTGTMPNRGAVNQTLNAGGSYTIPQGYHNGNGKVAANSLASQTDGTAGAGQILSGYTAWVGGNKVTGSMTNRGAVSQSLGNGASYTIPAGYHNGSGTVSAVPMKITYVGSSTSIDVKSALPNNYRSLTANNFLVEVYSLSATGGAYLHGADYPQQGQISASAQMSKSYNASTGIFTVSGLSCSNNYEEGTWNRSVSASVSVRIYAVYI